MTSATTKAKSGKTDKQIIRKNVLLSMGVGAVPIPLLDMAGITAIQLGMIKGLSRNYGVEFNKQLAASITTSLIGSIGAQSLATGTLGSMIKSIPIVGGVIGAITYPAIAGAMTYAVGQVFIRHFEMGGTLLTFDVETMKDYFAEEFKKGKEKVGNMKNATTGSEKKEK